MQSPVQSDAACRRIDFDQNPNTLAMEWMMNAPKFELLCARTGGSWRVQVRDANATAWTTLGQWSSAGWTAPRVQVFSDESGARRSRRFRVEYSYQLAWGIRLENRETLVARPPVPFPRRVVWCGDSFVEGIYSPSPWQGFAGQASAILGLDAHFDASGGTGYVSDGPRNTPNPKRKRYGGRLSNIAASNPSIIVVYGSINDLDHPTAQVVNAAKSYWGTLRRTFPKARIIVIGPICMGGEWSVEPYNTAFKQEAQRLGLPYIDASNWITGTGKEDDRRGDGNADFYRSSDGTHPTPAGHTFLGQKVAAALRSVINS